VGLGSTVLGPVTIGKHSRVGAGSVVVSSVPAHSTVVGVPGRVVKEEAEHSAAGEPLLNLDHAKLPDPLVRAMSGLAAQVAKLEQDLATLRADTEGNRERDGAPTPAPSVGSELQLVKK